MIAQNNEVALHCSEPKQGQFNTVENSKISFGRAYNCKCLAKPQLRTASITDFTLFKLPVLEVIISAW